MQGWLKEFVNRIGLKQSQDLLRDVGVIHLGKQKIRESPDYPRISDFEKLDDNIPVEKRYFGVNGEILPTLHNTTVSTSAAAITVEIATATKPIKNTTRSKVHWCHWRPHMYTPMLILQQEFGYTEEIDPRKVENDQWDLIFGGYPHCGDKKFDWKMETGVNKYLSKQGWDELAPHQIWFPCMGCKGSYCNKKDLCLLMKMIDPTYCYSLPDDRAILTQKMRDQQSQQQATEVVGNRSRMEQFWVLKEDHPDKHLHVGTGVHFIKSENELPSVQDENVGYLVQPLINHKMGGKEYDRRRHELKAFVCVTSTTPFRAYMYSLVVGKFANAQIDYSNPLEMCSVDTHGGTAERKLGCSSNKTISGERSFDEFSENVGITESEKRMFLSRTHHLIGNILLHAQPTIQNHTINKGITKSGATCFSFLRVDFAMTDTIEPYIFEINEFPFANSKGYSGLVQKRAYRDLFKMIGLDRPPMVASERRKYEMGHLGGWTPVVVDDVLLKH